jgi:hypothetical protein
MANYILSGISALFALFSVFIAYYVYKSNSVDTSYLDIDKQYADLLKLSLDEADFRNYEATSMFYKLDQTNIFKKKYHIYANLCWNLVETIYDRQKDKKGRFRISETWLPVIFEENRLHYTWFKHNVRLFKPDFQKFVSSELNDIEIVEGDINNLKEIYERFESDFPAAERKDYNHLEMLMIRKKYKLLLAKHKVFNEIIGYAFVYEATSKVLWLDYMAIDMKFQNAGYGTLLFNKIAEMKADGYLGIFLEVEIPDPNVSDERQKRVRFYERLGSKKMQFDYKLPTDHGGFPMYLYFKPNPIVHLLPKEIIKESISSAFDYIHSDIRDRDDILKTFLRSIHDEHFT